MKAMGGWKTFLDSLDSGGGHILILLLLMVGSFAVLRFDWATMKAGEIITGAFGALLMMLKSVGSNREQQGATTTAVISKTETGASDAP